MFISIFLQILTCTFFQLTLKIKYQSQKIPINIQSSSSFVVINFFLNAFTIYIFQSIRKIKSNRRSVWQIFFFLVNIYRVIIRKNRHSHSSFHLLFLLLLLRLLQPWWNFSRRSFWRKQMYPGLTSMHKYDPQWPLTNSRAPRHYASVASLVNEWLIANRCNPRLVVIARSNWYAFDRVTWPSMKITRH